MQDGQRLVARLARADVNIPNYDGFPMESLLQEIQFEAAAYALVQLQTETGSSRILYHWAPVQNASPRAGMPQDITGRRLMIFERADDENNVWGILDAQGRVTNIPSSTTAAVDHPD